MLSSHEIQLVQSSFRLVAPIAQQAATLFYARLFELDPSLRPLFQGDMQEQGRKLMSILAVAVSSLDRLDNVLPALRLMGARHAGYGVREEHYTTVGAALIWTLGKGLGPAFTPEIEAAWVHTYSVIAQTMINAAREAAYVA